MRHLLTTGLLALSCAVLAAAEARADGRAGPFDGRAPNARHHRVLHLGHALPPEVRYRDPRVRFHAAARPAFLIRAYLPRLTEAPIYNEPPPRW